MKTQPRSISMCRNTKIVVMAALLALTACDRASEPELTTTTTGSPAVVQATPTIEPPATTSGDSLPDSGATTVPAPRIAVSGFEIQVATTADEGDLLWITIPAEDYTDRDLENFLVAMADDTEGLWEVHVFDETTAVAAARLAQADRTPEEQQLVDEHYLVSLEEGNLVTFRGPFESAGSFIMGS